MTGVYPTGTTCASLSGQLYTSSYDAWGNVTSRSYNGVSATLSYDALDHLTEWNAGNTNQEFYIYDAAGERVARRVISSSPTQVTTYPFGREEHLYGPTGNRLNSTYYYSLNGQLIGSSDGTNTTFFMVDAQGTPLTSFSNQTGSATVNGNQVYSPYGSRSYHQGVMNTAKGFTGQYADSTGLDYYNARYYDPVVGRFVSADTKQGNLQGMDPYAYVAGNPETWSEPTGHRPAGDICSDGTCGDGGYDPHQCDPPTAACGTPDGPGNIGGNDGGNGGGNGGSVIKPKPQPAPPVGCKSSGCATWRKQAEVTQANAINNLKMQANWVLFGSYALAFISALMGAMAGGSSILYRIDRFIIAANVLLTGLLPTLTNIIQNPSVLEFINNFAHRAMEVVAVFTTIRGVLAAADAWDAILETVTATAILTATSGPAGAFTSIIEGLARPVLGTILDTGSAALYSLYYQEQADITRQSNMSVEAWCTQYQGCPSYVAS